MLKPFQLTILSILCSQLIGIAQPTGKPNIVIIYADDLGYGDLSCYGATAIHTPNIDALATGGILFRNAYASSATCTPSRYSLLTGQYAWRKQGTGIAPGNASLLIDTSRLTLPAMLKGAGYTTGAIGKWHLGMGGAEGPDWNGDISPGANEIGFDYSFLIPATTDRVPCVFVENHRVVRLDPNDPITVSYKEPVGDRPYGQDHPALLKLQSSHGHDQTIINGIGRIGYMQGGSAAIWNDSTMSDTMTARAIAFIEQHRSKPFFLYYASHDIHVPRVPGKKFLGRSGMGPRGDDILEFDYQVGELMAALKRLGLLENTLVILSSDNGPVLDDGYRDGAIEGALHPQSPPAPSASTHLPGGILRGGKYSKYEAGTRIPFVVAWAGRLQHNETEELFTQVDLLASLAKLVGYKTPATGFYDSEDRLATMLGEPGHARNEIVQQGNDLALIEKNWKYIPAHAGPAIIATTHIETGNENHPQLFNLAADPAEKNNLADQYPDRVKAMAARLDELRKKN